MSYLLIFAATYAASTVALLIWSTRQLRRMSARLESIGTRTDQIEQFERDARNLHLLVRPILFFGTLGGLLVSLIFWVVA